MRCDPPRGIGQPTACALASSERANAPVTGFSRRTNEWAATPASSALAAGVRKTARQPGHRLQRIERIAPDRERMAQAGTNAERAEQLPGDQVPVGGDRPDQPPVAFAVLAEAGGRGVEVTPHQRRAAVILGMGDRHRRLDPLQAVLGQVAIR